MRTSDVAAWRLGQGIDARLLAVVSPGHARARSGKGLWLRIAPLMHVEFKAFRDCRVLVGKVCSLSANVRDMICYKCGKGGGGI